VEAVLEKLLDIGVKQGAGVFFVLLVVVGAGFWIQNKTFMKQNNEREGRYISTIDKLADSFKEVAAVNQAVAELRKDFKDATDRQDRMLGRVLDRLPAKGGE
jgi:hypothetical protein